MESIMTGILSRFPLETAPHESTNLATYGWILQTPGFNHIDSDLRDIVMRCLSEKPKDRPTIVQLLEHLWDRKTKGFPEPAEMVGQWWNSIFRPQEPRPLPAQLPPAADPVQQVLVDTAINGDLEGVVRLAKAAANQGAGPSVQGAPKRTHAQKQKEKQARKSILYGKTLVQQEQPQAQPRVPPRRGAQPKTNSPGLTGHIVNLQLKRATQISTKSVAFDAPPKPIKSSRVSKRPRKTGHKTSPRKPITVAEYVEKALPDMPVAIRNLVTRSKHLEAQLRKGDFPVYAFMK
ncbi:hypothetical protein IL306_000403 [Fusarium sp. DS 682]|nr:hypothetical protein IL306_000403 [Fusarium sp. DS 682]